MSTARPEDPKPAQVTRQPETAPPAPLDGRANQESFVGSIAALSEIDALLADAQAKHSAGDSRIDATASLAIYALKGLGLLASRVDSLSDRIDDLDEGSAGTSAHPLDVGRELDSLRAEVRSLSKAVGRRIR